MSNYGVKLRQEKKDELARQVELSQSTNLAEKTEVFNLNKLQAALTNTKDVIDALDDETPKVAVALSNARSVKKTVETLIDDYPDYPRDRRDYLDYPDYPRRDRGIVIVENPPTTQPPPPPPSPPSNMVGETETFNLRNLKRALRNINDVIDALESEPPRVSSALSNAGDVKDALEDAIDAYDDDYDDYRPRRRLYRRDRAVRVFPPILPLPPPPPPPGMQVDGRVELADVTKTEDGVSFPAAAYAYVPVPQRPSTWKLRLWATPDGGPDARIVGAAVAALGKGFRGNKVQIPEDALPGVKARVRAAWIKANPDKDPSDIPEVIQATGKWVELDAETEEFNLQNLKTALTNINDTIDALESDPPRVSSALSNARTTKTAIQKGIDNYPGRPVGYRRVVRVVTPTSPPPPPPPPPPAS